MPQLIEVPGQGIVEFPSGMGDAEIAAAIQANAAPPQPAPDSSAYDSLGKQFASDFETYQAVRDAEAGGEGMAIFWCSVVVLILVIFAIQAVRKRHRVIGVMTKAAGAASDAKQMAEANLTSVKAAFYAVAEEEVLNGTVDRDLWSFALVKAGGDEQKRKVAYISLRAKQLKAAR